MTNHYKRILDEGLKDTILDYFKKIGTQLKNDLIAQMKGKIKDVEKEFQTVFSKISSKASKEDKEKIVKLFNSAKKMEKKIDSIDDVEKKKKLESELETIVDELSMIMIDLYKNGDTK